MISGYLRFWGFGTLLMMVVVLFCVVSVSALDKDLFNVSNCFNLTVEPVLVSGNGSLGNIGFSGCTWQVGGVWFCNCYTGTSLPYHLVMQTDGTILREPRVYDLRLRVNYFSFKVSHQSVTVEDWGDYVDREGLVEATEDFSFKRSPLEFVVVNRTVEVLRNVTVFEDRVVYRDRLVEVLRNVTVEVPWENTSKVDELNLLLDNRSAELNVLKSEIKPMWFLLFGLILGIIVSGIGFVFFDGFRKNG
jgi:hypothetical protein